MGFTWVPLTPNVMAETPRTLRAAVDAMTDLKAAPRFGWVNSLPYPGDLIKAARYSELQDGVDYAHDLNVCTSDMVTFNGDYFLTKFQTEDTDQDVNQDFTRYITVQSAYDIGYDGGLKSGYQAAKYTSYLSGHKAGVDSGQNTTAKSPYCTSQQSGKSPSCFTGDSFTILSDGSLRRVDSIQAGDILMGAHGQMNKVLGVEKVPVNGRPLLHLDTTEALFTGEHCFLLQDGRWGSFNKEAMDRELAADHVTYVEADGKQYKIVGDMTQYNDESVTQIDNGAAGMLVNGDPIPLYAYTTTEQEEFVYTMFMGGNRTWNIEGIVISGLAFTGDNPRLEAV